ncbi:MAG: hypothetical protein JOZ57_00275, partial [Abitibacteriaceae bacterium]|nr:hypothetical protein [Abditibacteriaceae bacterium]
MRRLLWILLAGALGFGVAQWRAQGRSIWSKAAPGLELRTWRAPLKGGAVQVIALRTSPSHVHIATGARLAAANWRSREAALMAVNGGFFDADGFSLGLRIAKGQRVSRLHSNKGGVFYVRDGQA